MSCPPSIKNDSYDFFNSIDTYITEAKKIENLIPENTPHEDCKSFSIQEDLGNKEKAESLCNTFASLNKFLVAIKEEVPDPCNFLNYWLNYELTQPLFSDDNCISYVYDVMDSQLRSKPEYDSLDCHLYNINKVELNKMNKLYNLYKNYSKLKTIIDSNWEENKQEILTLSTQCCADYNDVIYTCNAENKSKNPEFCDKLEAFISKYNELDNKVVGEEYNFSDYFIKLSDCSNNKIISTAVTGSIIGLIPLLGVLYKFTPMGQMLRSKMGILNNNISNNDEDMTNMSLIEQENEPLRFKQGTYNIKYQSL